MAFEAVDDDEVQLVRTLIVVVPQGILTIFEGFRFDGASIPAGAWSLIGLHPLHPKIIRAAAAHDAMYRSVDISRRKADKAFYKLMREDGIGRIKASIAYRSVRLFGWRHYNKERKKSDYIFFQPTNHSK